MFVDAGPDPGYRNTLVSEIEKSGLAVDMVPTAEDAEVVLRFYGEELHRPDYHYALHGGRGEVCVKRDGRFRPVLQFAGTRTVPWGAKPAAKFGAAFVEAYREANRHVESGANASR